MDWQDNICVLNTALIFFIFAERNGELTDLLHALREADRTHRPPLSSSTSLHLSPSDPPLLSDDRLHPPSHDWCTSPLLSSQQAKPPGSSSLLPTSAPLSHESGPGKVMKNFRDLLDFWREYYQRKRGRDCASLQFSTSIPFSEWMRIVDLLCAPSHCPTSLLHCPPSSSSSGAVHALHCTGVGAKREMPSRNC